MIANAKLIEIEYTFPSFKFLIKHSYSVFGRPIQMYNYFFSFQTKLLVTKTYATKKGDHC